MPEIKPRHRLMARDTLSALNGSPPGVDRVGVVAAMFAGAEASNRSHERAKLLAEVESWLDGTRLVMEASAFDRLVDLIAELRAEAP